MLITLIDFIVNDIDNYEDYTISFPNEFESYLIYNLSNHFLSESFKEDIYLNKIQFIMNNYILNKKLDDYQKFHGLFYFFVSSGFFAYLNLIKNSDAAKYINDITKSIEPKIVQNSIKMYCYLFLNDFGRVLFFKNKEIFSLPKNSLSEFQRLYSYFFYLLFNKSSFKEHTYSILKVSFLPQTAKKKQRSRVNILDELIEPYYQDIIATKAPSLNYKENLFKKLFSNLSKNWNLVKKDIVIIAQICEKSLALLNKNIKLFNYIKPLLGKLVSQKNLYYHIPALFFRLITKSLNHRYYKVYEIILSDDAFMTMLQKIEPDSSSTIYFYNLDVNFIFDKFNKNVCEIFFNSKLFKMLESKQLVLTPSLFDYIFITINPVWIVLASCSLAEKDFYTYTKNLISLCKDYSTSIRTECYYFLGYLCIKNEANFKSLSLLQKNLLELKIDDFKSYIIENFSYGVLYTYLSLHQTLVKKLKFPLFCNYDKETFLAIHNVFNFFDEVNKTVFDRLDLFYIKFILLMTAENLDFNDCELESYSNFISSLILELSDFSIIENIVSFDNFRIFISIYKRIVRKLFKNEYIKDSLISSINNSSSDISYQIGLLLTVSENLSLRKITRYVGALFYMISNRYLHNEDFNNLNIFCSILKDEDIKHDYKSPIYEDNDLGYFLEFIFLLAKYLPSIPHKGHDLDLEELRKKVKPATIKALIKQFETIRLTSEFGLKLRSELLTFLKSEFLLIQYLEEE